MIYTYNINSYTYGGTILITIQYLVLGIYHSNFCMNRGTTLIPIYNTIPSTTLIPILNGGPYYFLSVLRYDTIINYIQDTLLLQYLHRVEKIYIPA